MTDDLETLLAPPDATASANRSALLAASTRIVRRRFVLRRVGSWASVLAVFAVGSTAGWFLKPARVEREFVEMKVPAEQPAPAVTPPKEPAPSPQPVIVAMTPGELEIKAELSDDPVEVARLYREAGDKFLVDARDYAQAARCYRLHLNAATVADRQVTTADSWLLMTMKTSPR